MNIIARTLKTKVLLPVGSTLFRNRYKLLIGFSLWGASGYHYYRKRITCQSQYTRPKLTKYQTDQVTIHRPNFLHKFYDWLCSILRFIQLCAIFAPSIITLPLLLTPYKSVFFKTFVKGVQKAGVVFIKVFQYLSHRRDIIGEDLAKQIQPLRQFNAVHSYEETQKVIRRNFGKEVSEVFDQFNPVPIASGSVGQVYKAKFNGQSVAVKVLHPNVEKNINRDLDMLFRLSVLLSKFVSQSFQIPVTYDSLKRTLNQQMHLRREKENLQRFAKNFRGQEDIEFPIPFEESTDEVLIETFVQNSQPISFYKLLDANARQLNKGQVDFTLNKATARIGANIFFQMLMKHNFIHADCHGGNILVSLQDDEDETPKFMLSKFKYMMHKLYIRAKCSIMATFFMQEELKKLYDANQQEDKLVKQLEKTFNKKAKITLIDAGMAIELRKEEQEYFVTFLKQIIVGDPKKTAEMIYRISKYNNEFIAQRNPRKKQHQQGTIDNPKFPLYLYDLEDMLRKVRPTDKQVVQFHGADVLTGALNVIRRHHMKLDGEFATLLTNMLTLEAIAKDLDPSITILSCAIPYFIDRKKLEF